MHSIKVVHVWSDGGRYCGNEPLPPVFFFILAQQPPVGQGLLIHELSASLITTHHCRSDSSGRVISSSQRPLPDNTQHSQQTNNHARGGIRTHNLSRPAAANPRLRPRGHRDLSVSSWKTWNTEACQEWLYVFEKELYPSPTYGLAYLFHLINNIIIRNVKF